MRIDVYLHGDEARLEKIEALLHKILEKENSMSAELDRLVASVTAVRGKVDSLIALTNGLAQIIRDNIGNPAKLTELADALDTEATSVQAALDANPLPPTP